MDDSTDEVHAILSHLNLLNHEEAFRENGIETWDDIALLTREDLSELGIVKIGERNRLLALVKSRQPQPTPPSNEGTKRKGGKDDDNIAAAL
eukprot:10289826-Ditylum_brightwellii.AAC.1